METRVWEYLPEYHAERTDILSAIETVLESGQLIMGSSLLRFEQAFAEYHGISHVTGVGNGTNAITLALEAVGVGEGDEVITVSNTAAPTVVAIVAAKATPVFVDVNETSFLMDVSQLEDAVTPRTRAIVPVHLYGQCVDMDAVGKIARKYNLAIVEDCAQAHGARNRERLAGTMSDAGAFSFYPTKVLGAYGDGGAIITNSDTISEATRQLRYYGMQNEYYVVRTPGHNSRLDDLQAEILRRKLTRLNAYITARNTVAERYAEHLGDLADSSGLVLPRPNPENSHSYYLYVARHPMRDRILQELIKRQIRLSISYPWPVHLMSGLSSHGWRPGSLPTTEYLAKQIFSLPMYPSLSEERQDRVISVLRDTIERL